MNDYTVLAARIQQQLLDLERVVSRAEELWGKSQLSGDDGYLDGVALNLHGFYAGMERIFEDIARNTDGTVPDGSDWHPTLLLQMSIEIDGVRPPVISQESRLCLDDYCGFRHVVRNGYAFNLKASRVGELIDALRACYTQVTHDLEIFLKFLRALEQDESSK